MRALFFDSHGGIDELRVGPRPRPTPGEGQVRVQLRTAALNHLDLFVLNGMPGIPIGLPHIGGADGAGVVDAVGPDIDQSLVGQEVVFDPGLSCGTCEQCLRGEQSLCSSYGLVGEHADGTFAESVVVPHLSLAPRPQHLSWEEAAAMPLTFLTAWRLLFTRGRLGTGESVLIHGIGGGVSLACLQLAKAAGARVMVTSRSPQKLLRATELGADEAIPAGAEVVREVRRITGTRGVDVVVDSVGEATWLQSLKCCTRGGRVLTCGATTGPNPAEEIRLIFWNQLTIVGSTMGSRDDWRQVVETVNRSRLRPVVDSVFPLARGRDAYGRLEAGEQFGKIVLAVAE